MNRTELKLNTKQAKPIVGQVFPNYKGRKFRIEFTKTVTFHDTNWGGGTRNYYAAVTADGRAGNMHVPAPWVNPVEGKTVPLPPDVLLVEHAIFCGKDLGIRIYANPCHLPRWLGDGR